jgi:lipid-binding SYLF domain-containing protein
MLLLFQGLDFQHLKQWGKELIMLIKETRLTLGLWLLFSTVLCVSNISAREQDTRSGTDLRHTGKEAERALSAANILKEIMKTPESSIPDELMEHAHAVAVIPNMVKGAFGVGGTHGKGLIVRRLADHRWGTPSFIDLNGGSFGLQIGVSVTDLILVFTNENGLKGLFEDKLELGGEAGAAAGPVGRAAEAGTNLTFDSPIYSYSRSKGLFAGIALKGTVMTIDDSANQKVYGPKVTGRDLLLGGNVPPSPVVKPFLLALRNEVPSRADRETHKKESVAASQSPQGSKPPLSQSRVKAAQESLRDKGYYAGPIDGIVGPKTRNAIREYQKAENLPVNGRLNSETAAKLGITEKSVGAGGE